jgi:hypothetical protein
MEYTKALKRDRKMDQKMDQKMVDLMEIVKAYLKAPPTAVKRAPTTAEKMVVPVLRPYGIHTQTQCL